MLGNQIKKIPQLEAEVADLKYANAVQPSVHQVEVEAHMVEIERLLQEHTTQLEVKEFFCSVEKFCALIELQADYQAKLPPLSMTNNTIWATR